MDLNTIRKITIQGEGQQSLDSLAASVDKVKTAQANLEKESTASTAAQVRSAAATERLRAAQDLLAKSGQNSAVAQERVLLAQERAVKADAVLAASKDRLVRAQAELNAANNSGATVTDIGTKRSLSAAEAYKRQTLAVSDGARAQDQYAKAVRTLDAAMAQGVVKTTAEYQQRLGLLQQRYLETGNATSKLATVTGGLEKAFGAVSGAAAAFGLVLGVGALVAYGKSVFTTTADLQEQADQVLGAGGNVEAFQAFRGIFLTTGISMEAGDKIIARLTRSLGEAAEGSKKAQDAFHSLGLGSKQLAGATADAALPLVAAKLLAIQDASKRAAAETAIFGKTGQQLESALRELAHPIDELIAKAKALGVVIDADMIKKADDAKDRMALSWAKLSVSLAPIITNWVDGFQKFTSNVGGTTSAMEGLIGKVQTLASIYAGAKLGALFGGPAGAVVGGVAGGVAAMAVQGATQAQLDKAISGYDARLSGGGLSPSERQEIQGRRDRAMASYNDNVGFSGLVALPGGSAKAAASTGRRAGAASWAPNSDDIQNAERLKETFKSYLEAQQEAARLAGVTNTERALEEAVIKAAQIAQNEADTKHNLKQKDLIKTYADGAKYLGDQKVASVRIALSAQQTAPIERALTDEINLGAVALANSADQRALALEIAQKELLYGRELTDVEKERLKLRQQQNDATGLKDYIKNLKEEASLAGLSADERERQAAVLQAMHATHGTLRTDQAQEIQGIIAARQETERWRQLVDGIAGSFQSFFEDVLNKGKLSFGSLWDAIKQQFVQMLAYMATQALIAPIIIPMVQGFAGSIGGNAGGLTSLLGGGSSGGGLMSSLGSLGSIGSMFSGSGSLLGGLFGGGGAALGAGAGVQAQILAASGLPASFSTAAASGGSLLGGLSTGNGLLGSFGGGFGGFLGGAGVGALAGNLVFGNKNDASMGSMGGALAGAAIGSIIPGIGTVIGGLIGGLAGGGLGSITGSSNKGAISNFTNGGLGNTLFKEGGGQNSQMATQASASVNAALKTLQDAGVNVSMGNITGLSIGSDKSYVYDSAGGKQKLAGGDVEGVVNAILTRILPSATATNSAAQAILDKDGGLNASNLQQVLTDLNAAQQFMDALKNLTVGKDSLSEGAKALKQINDQIDPLVKQAQDLGQSTDTLETLRSSAIQSLVDDFNTAAQASLQQLTDPIGFQLDQIMQAQAARFQSGQDIGADTSRLSALNNAEISNFLKGLSADQLTSLSGSLGSNPAYQAANSAAQAQLDAAKAAASLTKNLNDMTSSINAMEKQAASAANAARQAASNWAGAADALKKSSASLLLTDQSLSPTDLYRNSRSQVDQLLNQARGGNVNSANDFASFAGQFLQTSFAFNGSTTAYQADRSFIQSSLGDLANFSDAQKTYAQRQADSLDAAVSRLGDIVNAVQNQTSETSAGLASMAAGLDDLTAEVKTSNLQSRMAA